ncbi:MAG: DUF59 domain-containing protein [Verrucomicrobia bacterium]|nr:DUF59 domain-containing protein [Verrucomicrobiota bacterium]
MSQHTLSADVSATQIPVGTVVTLPAGSAVFITQSLGGNVTVRTDQGLFRIAAEDAVAIAGYTADSPVAAGTPGTAADATDGFSEERVWEALRSCFDPEIPVNIVDLGLVYDLAVEPGPAGDHLVEVKMTLTAQGCGMGPVIAEDARKKIAALPSVAEARVHIVWDPVWNPRMISPAGRKALGIE